MNRARATFHATTRFLYQGAFDGALFLREEGLIVEKIKYYTINFELEVAATTSVYNGLHISEAYLVLRTIEGKYPYLARSGNTLYPTYFGFDFYVDKYAPVSTLHKNGWSIRFSELSASHQMVNNLDTFGIQLSDPNGDATTRYGYSSKTPEDILKAIVFFHRASNSNHLAEFELHLENGRLVREKEKLKAVIEDLRKQLSEVQSAD